MILGTRIVLIGMKGVPLEGDFSIRESYTVYVQTHDPAGDEYRFHGLACRQSPAPKMKFNRAPYGSRHIC